MWKYHIIFSEFECIKIKHCNCYHPDRPTGAKSILGSQQLLSKSKRPPAFYGTRIFIIMFTRACHWSLFWSWWIQFTPLDYISLRSILILSYHLSLGFPSGLFPSGFPTKTSYAFLFCLMHVTRLAHLILLDFIILIIFLKECKWWCSSICNFLQTHVNSSLVKVRNIKATQHCQYS
jgi:hypothetical protein